MQTLEVIKQIIRGEKEEAYKCTYKQFIDQVFDVYDKA